MAKTDARICNGWGETIMSTISCPHCGAQNPDGAAFCEKCGKAVPSSMPAGPRIVSGEAVASTAIGQTVQADQLRKEARKAAGALFAVAVLQVIGAALIYFVFRPHLGIPRERALIVVTVLLVVAVIYAALALWARANPLPPAIAGLVLFVTLTVADTAVAPSTIIQGIIVKVIIIVVLAKAVQAGIRYRRFQAQTRAPGEAREG